MTNDAKSTDLVISKVAAPWEEQLAARLRGFGPLGLFAIVVIVFTQLYSVALAAAMVVVWARLSNTPWREIGYTRPKSWAASALGGLVFGVVFKLLMKAVVMPLLGADPVTHVYQYLAGNRAEIFWFLLIVLTAGATEETVYRGYAFERLGKILGSSRWAKVLMIFFTSVWFGWVHYPNRGVDAVEQAAIVGAVFATIFAFRGRLFMLMCAHSAFDLAAYALIYWNLERKVAHWVFRAP